MIACNCPNFKVVSTVLEANLELRTQQIQARFSEYRAQTRGPVRCHPPARDSNHRPAPARSADPLVSVVTPVYNTAEYLADCIRSVLSQSYQTWEYVIVNNASTDGSLEIAESFAALDSRIRVVSTEHLLPQAVNHNFALRQISPASRYCKMVLADDWIYPNCLEEMVALAETDPEIAIVGAYRAAEERVVDPACTA